MSFLLRSIGQRFVIIESRIQANKDMDLLFILKHLFPFTYPCSIASFSAQPRNLPEAILSPFQYLHIVISLL